MKYLFYIISATMLNYSCDVRHYELPVPTESDGGDIQYQNFDMYSNGFNGKIDTGPILRVQGTGPIYRCLDNISNNYIAVMPLRSSGSSCASCESKYIVDFNYSQRLSSNEKKFLKLNLFSQIAFYAESSLTNPAYLFENIYFEILTSKSKNIMLGGIAGSNMYYNGTNTTLIYEIPSSDPDDSLTGIGIGFFARTCDMNHVIPQVNFENPASILIKSIQIINHNY